MVPTNNQVGKMGNLDPIVGFTVCFHILVQSLAISHAFRQITHFHLTEHKLNHEEYGSYTLLMCS